MPRHLVGFVNSSTVLVALAAAVSTVGICTPAAAQSVKSSASADNRQTAVRAGRVRGTVSDDGGRAIAGVNVLAVGGQPMPVSAKSDSTGQFELQLPPGEYILRAVREGYVSSYREAVRIQSRSDLLRKIVLVREGTPPARVVIKAGADLDPLAAAEETVPAVESADPDHEHSEAAWRLRHLPPTALRDLGTNEEFDATANLRTFKPSPTFVDWVMGESARAAASFFTGTNFTGEVNFLTSSALAGAQGGMSAQVPHGIAYMAVGAPIGSVGDWNVRGAMAANSLASWVVLGEYNARTDRTHVISAGVSYGSQPIASGSEFAPIGVNDRVRSVGGVYAFDRWHVRQALELDYGMRFDRYDYVADTDFVSPRLGVRLNVAPMTSVTVLGSQYVTAPGADEFLPPPSAGPWLPPERTFAPFTFGGQLQAERVRNVEFGVDQQLWRSKDAPVVGVRRFREYTQNQVATLFGLDDESRVGHYYVGNTGSMQADGWALRVAGQLAPRLYGNVQYTTSSADWTPGADAVAMAILLPSVMRTGQERLHDVLTSVTTNIPETSTKLSMAYRVSSAFSTNTAQNGAPSLGTRFQVEVRQGLPMHPMRGAETELILAVRNLFRDPLDGASIYDELLTVAPPMRVMGGVQVKF